MKNKIKTGDIVKVEMPLGPKEVVYLYRNHIGKYACQEPVCYLQGYILKGVTWADSVQKIKRVEV